jgi:hypothetical protein
MSSNKRLNKFVIITNGSGGCGKDEVAKIFQKKYKVYKYSSITKVKDIAAMVCESTSEKTDKARKFLSDFKLLTVDYNDMPLNDMKRIHDEFINNCLKYPSPNDKYCGFNSHAHITSLDISHLGPDYVHGSVVDILIFDIREPAEIQKAKEAFDAVTVLVTRPSVEQITTNMADANVQNYQYDYNIINDGTLEDLEVTVNSLIKDLEIRYGV